jgi:NADH:ubiquinone oxidoreductase subunit E
MADETQKSNDTNGGGGGCSGCCEEASEEELLARLDDVIDRYENRAGALIPVLQQAQGIFGYLPEVALKRIARRMQKPYSEVAGVVSFYSFFSTVPRGRNLIRVCLGTACYVRGSMAVLDALRKELGIDVGETTEDREFSLEVARCFGACGLAPVLTVNDVVHHRVKAARVNEILIRYAEAPVPAESVATESAAGEALHGVSVPEEPMAVGAGERSL